MPAKAITIFNGTIVGSSTSTPVTWDGGRSVLTTNASQYGPTLFLTIRGPSGAFIPICSSIVSDQNFSFDAPPGQYQLVNQNGSSISVVATLTSIPYL